MQGNRGRAAKCRRRQLRRASPTRDRPLSCGTDSPWKMKLEGTMIANYRILELLYQDAGTALYRARADSDAVVLLQLATNGSPPPGHVLRYRRSCEILRSLAVHGTARPITL